MKKVLATILALVMALGVTTMAWADGEIVAKVDTNEYTSLQEAVNAATAGQTIVMLSNVELAASLNVAAGKTVILDLNSFKITAAMNGPHMICNAGNLTITDNSESKTGEIAKMGEKENFGYVIENHGTMTLERCKISSTSVKSSAIENGWYTASQNSAGTECTMTIQNAEVVSVNAAGGLYTVKNDDYGVMVINGGVFTNGVAGAGAVLNWNDLTINGGTFTGASAVRTLKSGNSEFEKGKSQINNGAFNGKIDTIDGYGTGITVAVAAGTFSTDVSSYTSNGTNVALLDETYYVGDTAISNAVNSMGVGDTLTVVKGTVTINGSTVTAGSTYTVPPRYYYSSSTTTDTKKDDNKGTSPKTFDAGVGIYAVSAVLSLTGMAYVGKKKF